MHLIYYGVVNKYNIMNSHKHLGDDDDISFIPNPLPKLKNHACASSAFRVLSDTADSELDNAFIEAIVD
jgi:hypothetical protein